MGDNQRQSLSALIDNEADELEVRRVVKQLQPADAQAWSRYQMISGVLNGERPDPKFDLSAGVMGALKQEPEMVVPVHRSLGAFWKPFASVAVAASVSVMVIVGVQSFNSSGLNEGGSGALVSNDQVVLSGPQPRSSAFMPAQFGQLTAKQSASPGVEGDIIRMPMGMSHYLKQHQALLDNSPQNWSAKWLPEGFAAASYQVFSDSEVSLYSDGEATISVCVEPLGMQKSAAGATQAGDTTVLGKPVGDQFVTVVGDVPLMIADRIANSVGRLAK